MADLMFAANEAVTDALAACRCSAALAKAAAESCQVGRAAGTTAAANAPAAKFLHKVAAACAE
jgi:hypothetical protein